MFCLFALKAKYLINHQMDFNKTFKTWIQDGHHSVTVTDIWLNLIVVDAE